MSALAGSLSIGVRALLAQQAALETTSSNIANINTEGYVRRSPLFEEEEPVTYGTVRFGTGVDFTGVRSLRDRVLELQIAQTTSEQSEQSTFAGAMKHIESWFADGNGGISGSMNEFFNSITALSVTPSEIPARQRVLLAANNLASDFRDMATNLIDSRQQIDFSISAAVGRVNVMSAQIAEVNTTVAKLESLGQDTGAYEDRRTQLLKSLSELVGISVAQGDDGITVTTGNGTALVVGNHSLELETSTGPVSTLQTIYDASGKEITRQLSGGVIGGLLRARDQTIPDLQTRLDDIAGSLMIAINSAHKSGKDLNGVSGNDMFSTAPAGNAGAAASMSLLLSNPSEIAASSDGEPGGTGNLSNLSAISSAAIVSGRTPLDAFANIVYSVGDSVSRAEIESDAAEASLRLLKDQRGALSGVSLDEEAANLIRYQQAYQAAARIISVVDELTQVAINLGRG